jgi:MFS family permease
MLGTLGYVAAAGAGGGLLAFSLMSVVLGLGYTFYSGATEAWLVDALNATGYKGELDRIFARGSSVSGVAMFVGSVGGGLLGTLNLSIPYLARAGLLAVVFVIAFFTMHDIGFKPRAMKLAKLPGEMKQVAEASITFGWHQTSVRLLVIASFIWVAGVIAALISLAIIAGNSVVEWFTRFCGKRTTLLLWAAVIQTVATVGVGLADSFWLAVALYLVVMATWGVWTPVKQAYLHQLVSSEQRATVVSFDSLVGSGGSVLGQTALGRLAQTQSIAAGYVVGGLTSVLVWPVVVLLRRRNDEADVIVGTAGVQGACAAQGIPSVSGVDTTQVVAVVAEA